MLSKTQFIKQFEQDRIADERNTESVKNIIEDVKTNKDQAIFKYNKKFDNVDLEQIEVPQHEIKNSINLISHELKSALETSHKYIKAFQQKIKHENVTTGQTYQLYHPIEKVGIYVPGGKASYPSTVLMTATLAKVANVKEIIVVTPPQKDGIDPAILAACHITGVNRVFQVGGAQSIAALAYGTESIPKVDKIVGPGNQFVSLSKQLLYGVVGIDQIAGPSEIALIADEHSNVDYIIQDILAQAEHDEQARTFLLSTDQSFLSKVNQKLQQAIDLAPRKNIIEKSIKNFHYPILTTDINETIEVVNYIAPEHLSIQTTEPDLYIGKIKYVGAMFLGQYSPEAIGDYAAGPSHVLPTDQTARFSNGLTVNDFLTSHSVIHLDEHAYQEIAPSAIALAEEEGLYQHKQSLEVRLTNNKES
ncbi:MULTISPECIES: histidinol dehydrogenase [Mammaliicoccus]|uniref:Histidinol dehydrogenase n=1 Tax=Mammaliicoccus fleurettii TaxID=150056 RepID=A0ABS5MPW7_9STAP|nr:MULTISPECIES: histidinol dehydrogenase [Mammaliicoccus]MBL0847614.1 histidinol dehydrogenase [Mammaliicoccus fleurettii]MBS3673113.1 histidinol dehydrogenase [Mammaliicoccus fleurettii]MBS3697282.1 histidinol dehydrogenase [Mammaliicoccus fleurettii]MEB6201472.1 histidinol dehydrogenase [Mammaliicoccus fleurettii]MEB7806819.1 histidinol dehydrogenase [Mammaliicoccus fleurettii]